MDFHHHAVLGEKPHGSEFALKYIEGLTTLIYRYQIVTYKNNNIAVIRGSIILTKAVLMPILLRTNSQVTISSLQLFVAYTVDNKYSPPCNYYIYIYVYCKCCSLDPYNTRHTEY